MYKFKRTVLAEMMAKTHRTGLIFAAGLSVIGTANVLAQDQAAAAASADAGGTLEEVVITGSRRTIQTTIEMKRNAVQIVDGLSADDIGDIPALSIGDALETITGATSHRENGGATELSVRGLGPFLGTTVINGREATNGGGNRAVNFSIFPSEMFNSVEIHKTQSAEYIEGAVSGQVHLNTKKPLDHGKRLLQLNLKGAYSPDESNINGGQDFGSRGTVAYIDQFEFDNGGAFGVSLGVQLRDETNPEQEYTTTSGGGRLEACELTSFDANALPTTSGSGSGRCMDGTDLSNDGIQNVIDNNPNYNSVADIPFAYIPRDHRYRHNTTDDEREAVFGAFQWQPNERLDINVDFQYSERDQRELRQDLQYSSTQEGLTALTSNPTTGVVTSSVSETNIISFTTDFQRLEEYEGFGINVDYHFADNLTLSLDYSSSETIRTETDIELRLGATDNNLVGGNADDFTVQLDVNQGPGAAISTILDDGGNGFEVTDSSYFNARNRGRLRARQITRENTLDAFRADLDWAPESSSIQAVKAGMRLSSLEYLTLGGLRNAPGQSLFEDEDLVTPDGTADNAVTDAILANVLACANNTFPESSFLSNVRNGELITNAVSGTSVSQFATFDYNCAANAWLANYGGIGGIQFQDGVSTLTNDVTEDTFAFYLQADFASEWNGFPIRGNFGARFVRTDIESVGYRAPIAVGEFVENDGSISFFLEPTNVNIIEADTAESDYSVFLPSATLIVDLDEDLVLRTGAFRGMSRPDPDAYGNGRQFQTGDGNRQSTIQQVLNGTSGTGNPFLEPILSTNLDLGLEWYPNEDTIIGGAVYWKKFNGAFENVAQLETFNIDGNDIQGLVTTTQISDNTSTLTGFEFTVAHAFTYLPGFWSGFGGKFSYNYADSNFEFEDQHGGDGVNVSVAADGTVTETPLIGILEPANLFGLSEHVTATQLYWENDKINIQALYKTRSQYFQQFTRDTQGRIRYTEGHQTLDLKARYKLNSNVKISIEAKNVLDEPRIDYRGVDGNIYQALSYGPRIFAGVQIKL